MMGVECIEHECMWWTDFAVARAGEPENVPAVQRWDCSVNWSAVFQYSANFRLNGVQAATEDFRNQTLKRHDHMLEIAQRRHEMSRQLHSGNEISRQLPGNGARTIDATRED